MCIPGGEQSRPYGGGIEEGFVIWDRIMLAPGTREPRIRLVEILEGQTQRPFIIVVNVLFLFI